MSHLKSIGIDVGVIAKGLNHKVSLFSGRLDSLDAKDVSYTPVSIANYSTCACTDMTAASALDALAQLRAEVGDRVDDIEAQLAGGGGGGGGGGGLTDWSEDSNGHILPNTDNLQDVGSAVNRVRDLYLGPDSLKIVDNSGNVEAYGKAWFDAQPTTAQVTSLGTRIGALEQPPTIYQRNSLPLIVTNGQVIFVEDGSINSDPVLAYGYNGKWYRGTDNSQISDQTIDIYLLAGQSNAHGHADVSALDSALYTQDGIFYSSWHDNTSNASSTQYYSDWATSLVAGNTRGDSGTSTLGGSSNFGPELGFVNQANAINLTGGRPIGVLKHAIGASTLVDDPSDPSGGFSDWDLTATGSRRGDALRAWKLAISDGLSKLTNAGYTYRIAGMIWWQGESGATVSDLQALISHVRDHLDNNFTLDIPKNELPVVITKIGYGTDLTPVANADNYVGIVDSAAYGHANTNNHVGTATNPDTTGTGVNDMFEIGQAYADEMALATVGSSGFNPSQISTRFWLDADDPTTITSTSGVVTQIDDKSGNGYNLSPEGSSTVQSIASAQNGKSILRFDGDADATNWTPIAFDSTAVHKFFMVLKVTKADQNDALLTITGNGLQVILFQFGSDFKAEWYTTGGHMTGNTTALTSQYVMLSAEFNLANSTQSAWLNGTAYNTGVTNNSLSSFGTMSVRVGKYTAYGDADWGELVFTENLTPANSDKMEGYLAHKWGLAGDLPNSHPYKNNAP